MDKQPQNEQKELSAQEKRDMEMAAITLLDQIGVSFNIPLRKEEIEFFTKKKSLFKKIFHRVEKNPLPSGVKVNVRKMPNPDDPAQQIDYYEGEISIRPLRLATIDAMRYKRLELESKEPQLKEHLESTDSNDIYLFNYTREILEILGLKESVVLKVILETQDRLEQQVQQELLGQPARQQMKTQDGNCPLIRY